MRNLRDFVFPESAVHEVLATLAAFTIGAVVQNLRDFVFPGTTVHEIVVTGGGARNAFLVRRLAEALPECTVASSDDHRVSRTGPRGRGLRLAGVLDSHGTGRQSAGSHGRQRAPHPGVHRAREAIPGTRGEVTPP